MVRALAIPLLACELVHSSGPSGRWTLGATTSQQRPAQDLARLPFTGKHNWTRCAGAADDRHPQLGQDGGHPQSALDGGNLFMRIVRRNLSCAIRPTADQWRQPRLAAVTLAVIAASIVTPATTQAQTYEQGLSAT